MSDAVSEMNEINGETIIEVRVSGGTLRLVSPWVKDWRHLQQRIRDEKMNEADAEMETLLLMTRENTLGIQTIEDLQAFVRITDMPKLIEPISKLLGIELPKIPAPPSLLSGGATPTEAAPGAGSISSLPASDSGPET